MEEGPLPQKKRALARPRSWAVGLQAVLESFYTDFLRQLEPQECRGIALRKQLNAVAYCAISLLTAASIPIKHSILWGAQELLPPLSARSG
jgi:hypothetical protein